MDKHEVQFEVVVWHWLQFAKQGLHTWFVVSWIYPVGHVETQLLLLEIKNDSYAPPVVHALQLLFEVSPTHTLHFGSHNLIKIINYLTPKLIVVSVESVEIKYVRLAPTVDIV